MICWWSLYLAEHISSTSTTLSQCCLIYDPNHPFKFCKTLSNNHSSCGLSFSSLSFSSLSFSSFASFSSAASSSRNFSIKTLLFWSSFSYSGNLGSFCPCQSGSAIVLILIWLALNCTRISQIWPLIGVFLTLSLRSFKYEFINPKVEGLDARPELGGFWARDTPVRSSPLPRLSVIGRGSDVTKAIARAIRVKLIRRMMKTRGVVLFEIWINEQIWGREKGKRGHGNY